jgi:RNA polymerase sigma factor (sigma-70 family)
MVSAAQAVEALIHQYGSLVFHTIYGLTGDWEESQDLTQDTFQQVLKGIDAARAASGAAFNPRAWLLKIALNTVRMHERRKRLFRFVPFSRLGETAQRGREQDGERVAERLNEQAAPVQPGGYGAGQSTDPGELIAERDAVQRTLLRLPEALRVCLLLSIVGNFSTAEIAQMLDINEPAVRQRLSRARRQFQQFYALERGEEPGQPAPAPEPARRSQGHVQRPSGIHKGEETTTTDHRQKTGCDSQHQTSYDTRLLQGRRHAHGFYRDPAIAPLW